MKRAHGNLLRAYAGCAVMVVGICPAGASTYGTLNNFDTVNTTEEECHGFEIELEDCRSSDITRTYNYNHYGVPRIYDDDSNPEHVLCFVRWESGRNPDGTWSAYTAVPAGPIDPTNGHMFTNPNVNFGGEHFGVSYRGNPTSVKYFWLVARNGELVRGPEVQVATPVFSYSNNRVRVMLEPPEEPEPPRIQFGKATWVKAIKTTTHNDHDVDLRDLVSDDPDDEHDVNWRNGEPEEVEMEWHLLQEEFDEDGEGDGGEGLEGEPADLEDGDEIVTRRWEFYEYTGPLDPENGEALADKVAPDGEHGVGTTEAAGQEYDLENTVVVGQYLGAQMSAFDVDPDIELCDHLQDGEVNIPYPDRAVVIGGLAPFTATSSGDLPSGMTFDEITGILSGTPTSSGEFSLTVEASDPETPAMNRTYNFKIAEAGAVIAPHSSLETDVFPVAAGAVVGGGSFDNGMTTTVVASPMPGYKFVSWTEQGAVVSLSRSYEFTVEVNRSLVANFSLAGPELSFVDLPGGDFLIEWPLDPPGWILQESSNLHPESWQNSTRAVTDANGMHKVTIDPGTSRAAFFRLSLP